MDETTEPDDVEAEIAGLYQVLETNCRWGRARGLCALDLLRRDAKSFRRGLDILAKIEGAAR